MLELVVLDGIARLGNINMSGRLAQLGERRVRNAEAGSSILPPSTKLLRKRQLPLPLCVYGFCKLILPATRKTAAGPLTFAALVNRHYRSVRRLTVWCARSAQERAGFR